MLEAYLPAQMSGAEIEALIGQAITSSGATSPKDMGKVMAVIKSQAQGRADMSAVSALVRDRLGRLPG